LLLALSVGVVSSAMARGVTTMRTLVLTMVLMLPLPALAQSTGGKGGSQPQPKVEYEKKTVINFEDDTIEGDLKRPDGEYVESRRKVDHSNLIKIRENWRDKVMQASGDL
jgi:hypothetical protein